MSEAPMYGNARDEAAAKRELARTFDAWAEQISALLNWAADPAGDQVVHDGTIAWAGPAAQRFLAELMPLRQDFRPLPGAFAQTARNLRSNADSLLSRQDLRGV